MNFIDEMLAEVEIKEEEQTEAYMDLLLLQIRSLNDQMENNFHQAEKEVELINKWVLNKNTIIQERITFIEKQLESFVKEKEVKTLDLAHGILKIRKQPDKAEVFDLEKFLNNANRDLVTVIPETIKPNLNAIKAFHKRTGGKLPEGCRWIEGEEKFSYVIKKEEEENAGEKEAGAGVEQAGSIRDAV